MQTSVLKPDCEWAVPGFEFRVSSFGFRAQRFERDRRLRWDENPARWAPASSNFEALPAYSLKTSNAFFTLFGLRIRSPRRTLGDPLRYAYSMLIFFEANFFAISDSEPG